MDDFVKALKTSAEAAAETLNGVAEVAINASESVIKLNEGSLEFDSDLCSNLMDLIKQQTGDRLITVCLGTLWREDCPWLEKRDSEGNSFREHLLEYVASSKPDALSPDFWTAVAERGQRFVNIAYRATKEIFPSVAAKLLVRRCQAAIDDPFLMDIGTEVRQFIDSVDIEAKNVFLDTVKKLHQLDKRKLMTHLDMSLMSELDDNSIEHKGKDFYYDEDAERRKREAKGEDIFSEVARRLKNGETPS